MIKKTKEEMWRWLNELRAGNQKKENEQKEQKKEINKERQGESVFGKNENTHAAPLCRLVVAEDREFGLNGFSTA